MKILFLLLVLVLACLAHTASASLSELNWQLFKAAKNGDFEAVKTLLDRGADIDAKVKGGLTPLHLTAWEGNTKLSLGS
jgi:ankyrin repeat protein